MPVHDAQREGSGGSGVDGISPTAHRIERGGGRHRLRDPALRPEDEAGLLSLLNTLLQRIRFFEEDAISLGSWTEAWRLCRDVDENDVAYVALALELEADLWTSDRQLEAGLRKKGFSRFFTPEGT